MDAMNSITGGCEVHERSSHIGVAVVIKENRMEEEGNNEIIIIRNLKKKKAHRCATTTTRGAVHPMHTAACGQQGLFFKRASA